MRPGDYYPNGRRGGKTLSTAKRLGLVEVDGYVRPSWWRLHRPELVAFGLVLAIAAMVWWLT